MPPSDAAVAGPFPDGATLREGDRGWVLVEAPTARSAGPAAVWAVRNELRSLHLVVGGDDPAGLAGDLARRLGSLAVDTRCSAIVGTDLVGADPTPVPAPEAPPGFITAAAQPFAGLFGEVGLEVVVEHGVVRGEVHGLEVARVAIEEGEATLGVGVGRFDREITAMLHAELPDADAVVRAAGIVREHRFAGGPPHPLMSMGRSRWVRSELLAAPSTIGLVDLVAVDTTVQPPNLRDPHPAAALGRDGSGRTVVVVCGAGVDLDLVTLAADTRARHAPDADLLLVVPEGDRLAPVVAVGDALGHAPRWVECPPPWATGAG